MTGEPLAMPLASRGQRLGAALLDWLVCVGALLAAMGIARLTERARRPSVVSGMWLEGSDIPAPEKASADTTLPLLGALTPFGLAALFVTAVVVYQMALIATTGQSLGKRWCGIDIVRMDGRPPGFVHGVLLRTLVPQLVSYLPTLLLWEAGGGGFEDFPNALTGQLQIGLFGLVDLLPIFLPDSRCLHDYLAGTRVGALQAASGAPPVRVNHLKLAAIALCIAPMVLVAPWAVFYTQSCMGSGKDCDGQWSTLCESDLDSVETCGDCGVVCGKANAVSSSCTQKRCVVACKEGYGNCDGYSGNGCEVELASDSAHCGSCGVDCRGAECKAGACGPRMIGKGAAIAVDETAVYALNSGVVKYPLDGGAPLMLARYGDAKDVRDIRPRDMAVDKERVYWIPRERDRILSMPVGGGTVTTVADRLDSVMEIEIDGEAVVWMEGTYGKRKIKRGSTSGDGSSVMVPDRFLDGGSLTLLADSSVIYWAGRDLIKPEDVIWSLRGGSARPEKFVSNTLVIGAIASDATNIYWIDAPRSLMTLRKAGGTPTVLAPVSSPQVWLLVDDTYIYWGQIDHLRDGSNLMRLPKMGGEPELVASAEGLAFGLALNSSHLFWIDGQGTILMAPKQHR